MLFSVTYTSKEIKGNAISALPINNALNRNPAADLSIPRFDSDQVSCPCKLHILFTSRGWSFLDWLNRSPLRLPPLLIRRFA